MSLDLYEEIVDSINPDLHDMDWSMSVTLDPDPTTGDTIWWNLNIQFARWYDYIPGLLFTYQDSSLTEENIPVVTVPENQVPPKVIARYITFFESES